MLKVNRRIDFDRYRQKPPEKISGGVVSAALEEVMCHSMELNEVIFLLGADKTVWWVSNGNWSMHQMLMALLEITGPAAVVISSYAMGETPARVLAQLKEDKTITSLYVLIDDRVDTRSAGSAQLVKSIADEYALVSTHAKVTVVFNERHHITVVGSANYTENKRFECGIVTTCRNAFEFNTKWISKALADGNRR